GPRRSRGRPDGGDGVRLDGVRRTRARAGGLSPMLAEFTRPDAPEQVVATAGWDGRQVRIVDEDLAEPELAEAIQRIFRPVPVVVDDPSLRSVGTEGPAMLEPGDLQWFMAAARSRSEHEGLVVRLV